MQQPDSSAVTNRIDAINLAIRTLDLRSYVEIGIRSGAAFSQISGARLKCGVDPQPKGRRLRVLSRLGPAAAVLPLRSGSLYFRMTSDRFFARHTRILERNGLDVALVDGLHTADQAYKDVENCLRYLSPRGVIIMHDCSPRTAWAARPLEQESSEGGTWNGDVFKAIVRLRSSRTDIRVSVLDADHGLGLVTWGDPEVRLGLDPSEIEALTFDDLERDRTELLKLEPVSYLGAELSRVLQR
jgi:hypothetical protein